MRNRNKTIGETVSELSSDAMEFEDDKNKQITIPKESRRKKNMRKQPLFTSNCIKSKKQSITKLNANNKKKGNQGPINFDTCKTSDTEDIEEANDIKNNAKKIETKIAFKNDNNTKKL